MKNQNHQNEYQPIFQLTKEDWDKLKTQTESYYNGLVGDRLHEIPKKRFVVSTRFSEQDLDQFFEILEEHADESL